VNYGKEFCDLTYEALRGEEQQLAELASGHPNARPLSVCYIGELAIAYLIAKRALTSHSTFGEAPYEDNRSWADICFVDAERRPLASFELKICHWPASSLEWNHLQSDVIKHLDPRNKICKAHESLERYNALLLIGPDQMLVDQIERTIANKLHDLVSAPKFHVSSAIELNVVDHRDSEKKWRYLRVVVFSGEYIGSSLVSSTLYVAH
jgi:hypothetical protein